MRINVEVGGVGSAARQLADLANGSERLARAQEALRKASGAALSRPLQGAAGTPPRLGGFAAPGAAVLARLEAAALHVNLLADAYRKLGAAQKGVSFEGPRPAPGPGARPVTETTRRVSKIDAAAETVRNAARMPTGNAQRLTAARKTLGEALKSGTPEQLQDARAAVARAEAAAKRDQALLSGDKAPAAAARIQQAARPPAPFRVRDVNERVQNAALTFKEAKSQGNAGMIEDAQIALRKAVSARDRARKSLTPPSPMDRFSQLAYSTRIGTGPGGNIAPLFGRMLSAVGMRASAAGPVGLAVGALIGGATLANKALQMFARNVGEAGAVAGAVAEAGRQSGGTPAQVAALGAHGVPADQMAGHAAALRERLATDPMAMLASASGPQLPRPFGSTNEAQLVLREMIGLRTEFKRVAQSGDLAAAASARLRRAQMLGMEWALKAASVSERVWQAQQRQGEIAREVLDELTQQRFHDISANADRFQKGRDLLQVALLKPLLGGTDDKTQGIASAMDLLVKYVNQKDTQQNLGGAYGGIKEFILGTVGGMGGSLLERTFKLLEGIGNMDTDAHDSALDRNTRMLEELGLTIRQNAGSMGGRTVGAVSGSASVKASERDQAVRQAMLGEALKHGGMGAFGGS